MDQIKINRPPRAPRNWAKYNSPSQLTAGILIDPLILVNTRDDTYIACQDFDIDGVDGRNEEQLLKKVLERLQKSELVNLLDRPGRGPAPEVTLVEKKAAGDNLQELIVDMRLGGLDRRFLVQYKAPRLDRVFFLVGCARRNRFEAFQEDFRKAFETFHNNQ